VAAWAAEAVVAVVAVVAVIAALYYAGTGLYYAMTGVLVPRAAAEDKAPAAPVEFTADGKLKLPVAYRKWVYVGEVVTPNDMNDGEASFPEYHSVYMDPESFAHFEKTGKYRDGTVLIKELSSVGAIMAGSRIRRATFTASPITRSSFCKSSGLSR
jgi:hypothetical protein